MGIIRVSYHDNKCSSYNILRQKPAMKKYKVADTDKILYIKILFGKPCLVRMKYLVQFSIRRMQWNNSGMLLKHLASIKETVVTDPLSVRIMCYCRVKLLLQFGISQCKYLPNIICSWHNITNKLQTCITTIFTLSLFYE